MLEMKDLREEDTAVDPLKLKKDGTTNIVKYFTLPCDKSNDSFNNQIAIKIISDYIDENDRLLYSEITNYIVEFLKINLSSSDDKYDEAIIKENEFINNLTTNLNNCVSYSLKDENKIDDKIKKVLLKLWDHTNLAIRQFYSFYQNESEFRDQLYLELQKKIYDLEKDVNDLHKDVKKAKKLYNNMNSQIISMISIFVAIAFVMFGGMSLINDLFQYVNNDPVPLIELICLGSLVGIVMIVVIYSFVLFMLQIINKSDSETKGIYIGVIHKACKYFLIVAIIMFVMWFVKNGLQFWITTKTSDEQTNEATEELKKFENEMLIYKTIERINYIVMDFYENSDYIIMNKSNQQISNQELDYCSVSISTIEI